MFNYHPIIQTIQKESCYSIDVLRLDLIHPEISGNKWFKLKRNIEKAKKEKHNTLLTFGGAFSNHIAATASACKLFGLKCIGIIRGEEPKDLNPTLQKAKENGMYLHFVSREVYHEKNTIAFQNYLTETYGKHYLIPEGGNNEEGVLGCLEILNPDWHYDYVFCACGTATTFTGILAGSIPTQKIIGISVLKGENALAKDAESMVSDLLKNNTIQIKGNEAFDKSEIEESCISNNYCFNGYAKFDSRLIDFKNNFEASYKIPLDYVYTNKLFYAVFDLIDQRKIKISSKILVVHCGGLQGNEGFEKRYHLMPNL